MSAGLTSSVVVRCSLQLRQYLFDGLHPLLDRLDRCGLPKWDVSTKLMALAISIAQCTGSPRVRKKREDAVNRWNTNEFPGPVVPAEMQHLKRVVEFLDELPLLSDEEFKRYPTTSTNRTCAI